ncbi:MAG: mechanosensitive ion channel family protein [Terracidiphilus sp.]|jgi:small-conductance mechanosensitive channel
MGLVSFFQNNWRSVAWSAGILAAAIGVALIVRVVAFVLLKRLTRQRGALLGESLVRHGQRPSQWVLPFLAVLVVIPGLPLPGEVNSALEHIAGLGLIATMAWLAILLIAVTSDILSARYRIDVDDNLEARRIQTQFQMIHRIAVILVAVVALAVGLMTFPDIKHIGVSILASAGVASLVVGMAMKDTLTNLIAGVQIAFAQPFRIGDAVVLEGEYGWIEEIGMMYVVVRIWDLRRLVLPLSYFLTNAFQNWTRTSADLLAYTYLYVDYTVPVDAVREELRRICEGSPMWNKKVCGLQVSDSDAHTMQLRALMDVRNSSDAWDLRCLVREKLIDFLQKNYPGSLPRQRGEFNVQAVGKNLAAMEFSTENPPGEDVERGVAAVSGNSDLRCSA